MCSLTTEEHISSRVVWGQRSSNLLDIKWMMTIFRFVRWFKFPHWWGKEFLRGEISEFIQIHSHFPHKGTHFLKDGEMWPDKRICTLDCVSVVTVLLLDKVPHTYDISHCTFRLVAMLGGLHSPLYFCDVVGCSFSYAGVCSGTSGLTS